MAVNAFMDATPNAPDHGDMLTVAYTVTGNDPTAPSTARISGAVVVGGQRLDLSTSVTLPGTPAASVTFEVPECEGLTFTVKPDDASEFTAPVA